MIFKESNLLTLKGWNNSKYIVLLAGGIIKWVKWVFFLAGGSCNHDSQTPIQIQTLFFSISSGERRQVAASLPRKRLPFGSKPLRRRWELWALSGSGMLVVNNHRLLHHFIAKKIYKLVVNGLWWIPKIWTRSNKSLHFVNVSWSFCC